MKTISKILAVTMLSGSLTVHAQRMERAEAGHRGGNGGNSIASHFSTIARNVQIVWDDICTNEKDPEAYCNYVKDFESLLNKDSGAYVLVKGEKDPQKVKAYDGEIREAINYVDPDEIIVNEQAWKDMIDDAKVDSRRINLVMHEYLTFIGLDSSDHYDYSNAIYGMLSRKGYDLGRLASFEGIPSPCSMTISGQTNNEMHEQFKKGLIKKGYLVKNSIEQTRYSVKVNSACTNKTATNSCAVHVMIEDNYTNAISFNEMAIKNSILGSEAKIVKTLTDSIVEQIPAKVCKDFNK
jgi:hypothetical protein